MREHDGDFAKLVFLLHAHQAFFDQLQQGDEIDDHVRCAQLGLEQLGEGAACLGVELAQDGAHAFAHGDGFVFYLVVLVVFDAGEDAEPRLGEVG